MKPVAAFAMGEGLVHKLFHSKQLDELTRMLSIDMDNVISSWTNDSANSLEEIEILITGWGAPLIDEAALEAMPKLSAILHTAGTVRYTVDPIVYRRGITVTTCAFANSEPVAEFALAEILLAGKKTLRIEQEYRRRRGRVDVFREFPAIGNYGSTVGLVSASTIGARVAELLRPFDIDVIVYDPYVSGERIAELGATKKELNELLRMADVVSVHTPVTPETIGLLDADRLRSMKNGATLINTARPQIIDNEALRVELASGRLDAVLDVTDPEPLPADDLLWSMPHVRLTPHMAGSLGNELHRMGASTVEEVRRRVTGEGPLHRVTEAMLATMA